MELRWFLDRPGPWRQLGRLHPACGPLPGSDPPVTQRDRHVRDVGPGWDAQQVQLPARGRAADGG